MVAGGYARVGGVAEVPMKPVLEATEGASPVLAELAPLFGDVVAGGGSSCVQREVCGISL